MKRTYADDYRGWPVAPKLKQHPVRGSFLDPRPGEKYHHGMDVSVRDDKPAAGAPPGCTHRVFALEGGQVWKVFKPKKLGAEGIVRVGHFGYGHVLPVVQEGQTVKAGDLIAWTVKGGWHVHVSEWVFPGGDREKRVPVNPLDRRGKIAPYSDLALPVIHEIRFRTPASPPWRSALGRAIFAEEGLPVDPQKLAGLVDVRARIDDPQSFRGWLKDLPILETALHPARVRLTVTRLADGVRVVDRDVFTCEATLGPEGPKPVPISHHFAPGTKQNLRAPTAIKLDRSGRGQLWFRLFARLESPYWNTTLLPNGPYRLKVTAWDTVGNKASEQVDVAILNL